MGIPDHLTCLLRSLYAGQEATVRTGHGTTEWFQIGKGVHQGYILSPYSFKLYTEYIMRNAGLEETQAGIKVAGRNINMQIRRWHHSYGREWRRTKEPLDENERGEWKSWLKVQHSEIKVIASGPIDGDCSHEIKRCLLLGMKGMTNLDSILKSRDITLSTKVHLVKAMVFPLVMYGCESWSIK